MKSPIQILQERIVNLKDSLSKTLIEIENHQTQISECRLHVSEIDSQINKLENAIAKLGE